MNRITTSALGAIFVSSIVLAACHPDPPETPRAVKEDVKRGVDKAGEGLEKAGDKVEDATDKVEEKTDRHDPERR